MAVESLGALLLVGGLLTRVWALAIGAAMTICMFMIPVQHGFFMNWFGQQQGEGFEFHILDRDLPGLIDHGRGHAFSRQGFDPNEPTGIWDMGEQRVRIIGERLHIASRSRSRGPVVLV